MANINSVFGGGFLKAEDLQGRNIKVKISKVEVKNFDDGDKLIVHFDGKDKALVCNKTNASIIAEVTGKNDTDDWNGESIWLVPKKVEFQGKLVPAIRVALEPPAQAAPAKAAPKPAQPAPSDDDGIEADDVPF
jgi:hypothetical protein